MPIGPLFRPLLATLRADGVDVDRVLAPIGTSEAELLAPETRVSPSRSRALTQALLSGCGDPAIMLRAAERFELVDADLLGYLTREATHPLAMLEAIARFARLLGDSAECRVERGAGTVVFVLGSSGAPMLPEATEFYLAVIVLLLRRRSGGAANPLRVALPRPAPRRADPYRQLFGCKVAFSSDRATLSYAEATLLAPLAGRDPHLGEILQRGAVEALAQLPKETSLVERALAFVSAQLDETEPVGVEWLAARFGMSERTLRRHLADEGVTYRDILDRARHARAVALLREGERTIAEVALLVGFEDATSFTRAFRRWTGEAPRASRTRPKRTRD